MIDGPEDPFGPQTTVTKDGTILEWMLHDMDPLEQTCRRLEIMVDQEGWDCRPHFYNLAVVGNLPSLDLEELNASQDTLLGGIVVSEVNLPEFVYENPGKGLLNFLAFLSYMGQRDSEKKDLIRVMNKLVPTGFFGFAAVSEAWKLPDTVPLEERQMCSRADTTQDHPDRIELRGLIAATVDGRVVSLSRERGGPPTYLTHSAVDNDIRGRVPTAVRLICDLFGGFDKWRKERITSWDWLDKG